MKADGRIDRREELKHRLRDAGIRPRADLLARVLDDYEDMKRHIAAVREAAAVGGKDNSSAEATR